MNLNIRFASQKDIKNVFMLANDDLVRANSINSQKIKYSDHERWFNDKIKQKDTLFYILEIDENFAGYARLDKQKNGYYLVSIDILAFYRGKKLGNAFLKNICEQNEKKPMLAYVKTHNIASKKIFENNNFTLFDEIIIKGEKYYIFKKF